MNVAVLGAGSWGTALASVFAKNGSHTTLWARDARVALQINANGRNSRYLPDADLPKNLIATNDVARALEGAQVVLFAIPSLGMRNMLESLGPKIPDESILCHAVKGFDAATKHTMSELILEYFPGSEGRLAVISGPSHAEEVVQGMPTTIVAAAYQRATAELLQDLLMNRTLRVYTNPDVKGAEFGGALKNIIALGVGIADGLGFGDNAKAALMTRGLTEIARLGLQMGASLMTFAGLSGVGDLIVTCTSLHSRNYRTGRLLGQGATLEQALQEVGMAVEGVATTKIAFELAEQVGVEMPITGALHQVLFAGSSPRQAVEDLMTRARVHEMEDVALEQISAQWN